MRLVIPEWTQEVLWGFSKLGIAVSQRKKCDKCKEWCRITVIPNKKLLMKIGKGKK
jgi:hypothetical protein